MCLVMALGGELSAQKRPVYVWGCFNMALSPER